MLPRLKRAVEAIFSFIMTWVFRLILLTTSWAFIPVIVFILYNMYYFNCIRAITGCAVILTLVYVNKSVQGGN